MTGRVRLVLDATGCDGHGICALRCPERISLDEWGYPVVDPTVLSDARSLRRARKAVAGCPRRALALEENDQVSGDGAVRLRLLGRSVAPAAPAPDAAASGVRGKLRGWSSVSARRGPR